MNGLSYLNDTAVSSEMSDIILGRPIGFLVGEDRFCLYPVTLGKMLTLRYYYESLDLKRVAASAHPEAALLSMVHEKKALCAEILAIHTLENDGKSLFDMPLIKQRADFFSHEMRDEDLASLLNQTLDGRRLDRVAAYLGIDKERERLQTTLQAKENSKNNLTFCGKTIFGSFMVPLKEMGFTLNEIIFECSYDLLRLLIMDKQVSLFMSDDELKDLGGNIGALIDGESGDADDKLRAFFASRGVEVGE